MEFPEKPAFNKSKMFCCVPSCNSKANRCPTLSFHTFPSFGRRTVKIINKFGKEEVIDIRKAWEWKLKMGKNVSNYMRVCSLHFIAISDYCPGSVKGKNKWLKKNAVPSVNLPKASHPSPDNSKVKERRSALKVKRQAIKKYLSHQRSYGKWWNESEAAQPHYMSQDVDPIISEDFVTVRFDQKVIPETVSIYEIYNPGAIVRIWARSMQDTWILLWEGPPQTGEHISRKFSPPIRKVLELVNEIRIELNQSLLHYHTALDAVLLTGYQPNSKLQFELIRKGIYCDPPNKKQKLDPVVLPEETNYNLFSKLPNEIILHILKYLDLKSLCRCAQVNKRMYQMSLDPSLYQEISLNRYWHKVDDDTLNYFISRSRNIKKLDLSWCYKEDDNFENLVTSFMAQCCPNLTHLSLGQCKFVKAATLTQISNLTNLTDLRLRGCKCRWWEYTVLSTLDKLTALDLYATNIVNDSLVRILKRNKDLKYLNIDFCDHLEHLDVIAETVSTFNPKLVTWSSWKTRSLSAEGVNYLANCENLRELDVGWCLFFMDPGDCLERLANGCKDLRRLIICGWRGVNDHLLLPIIESCNQLTELDLLGIKSISADVCSRLLASLSNLKLLDISFCDSIHQDQVKLWREQYPDVVIQRSCCS